MAQRKSKDKNTLLDELTGEELRVLELVVAGKSTDEIANALKTDADTVWRRLQAALAKLLGRNALH